MASSVTTSAPPQSPGHLPDTGSHTENPITAVDLRTVDGRQRAHRLLFSRGLAIFAGVNGPNDLLAWARECMRVRPHPDSDATGLTTITDHGAGGERPNAAGFSRRALSAHTDRSGVPAPPALLMTSCAQTATTGGACRLTDGKALHDDLAVTCPEALSAFTRPRTTLFGGTNGYLGSVFTDSTGGPPRRTIRLRLDDLVRFSPQIQHWLPALHAAIDRHTHTITLQPGEGYILDNHRWLHARNSYTGARVLYRLHGDPLPTLGLHPGIPL